MYKAAHWRLFQQLLLGLLFIATGVGVPSVVHAESVDPADPKTAHACQEQFLLDRRDQPQRALQKLRQCDAIHDASANVEEFTLWYITLPARSAPEQNTWFANVWRNKLRTLTSPPISLSKEEAIGILDDAVERALKRGKREDLSPRWLASHDPAMFAPSASVEAHDQTHNTRVTRSREIATPPAKRGESAAKVAAFHPMSKSQRAHLSHPANRYEARDYEASTNELNRAEKANHTFSSGQSFYVAPAYYPSGVQQQPYPAHSNHQEPSSSSYQQARPAPAPQPITYVDIQHQPFTGPRVELAPLPLPLQIEANVRAMIQQVTVNIQSFEQAISRQLRGH